MQDESLKIVVSGLLMTRVSWKRSVITMERS